MADQDEDGSSGAHDDDELASKLARLTEEKQTQFHTHVHNTVDRNTEASQEYRLKLADTFLKNLSVREEAFEIRALNRRQDEIAYRRDHQRDEHDRSSQTKSPVQEPRAAERGGAQPSSSPEPKLDTPLQEKHSSGTTRDYAELQRTHEKVAEQLKRGDAQQATREPAQQPAEPATAILSKEHLQLMIEHFPDIRREANLRTSQSEIHERAELARAQDADRLKLEQTNAGKANPTVHEKQDLLDYQHLAERVGVQAKWIALDLKTQGSPEAEKYGADARLAFHTGRQIHERRQNLGTGIEQSQEAEHIAQADQQKQADAHEAVRTGRVLNSDQRANLSPEARPAMDRKERADTARKTASGAKDHKRQQGSVKIGKSKDRGGRSR